MTEKEVIAILRKKNAASELYNACILALEALNAVPVPLECRQIVSAAGQAIIYALNKADNSMEYE
jgi:hypothetical protein